MTAQDYKAKIDPAVLVRLESAITSLLNAGRDTHAVRDALRTQQSFGKYEGCHPAAILSIANEMCAAHNAKAREEDREILRAAAASLRRQFPDIAKYFRK